MQSRIYHLHTLSALHCGVGQATGTVDLPIARARATQLPIVPGSSLRGVLRAHVEADERMKKGAEALFGPRTISGANDAFAGALSVGDANLLLLPVRSLAGVVCFATSPFVLAAYRRDRLRSGLSAPELPQSPDGNQAKVGSDTANLLEGKLVLEDLDLDASEDPKLTEWARLLADSIFTDDLAGRVSLSTRIALLPDDIFVFLAETATEVRTRIAINPKTGVVRPGMLWFEENLPAESILWGVHALTGSNKQGDERDAQALEACLPASGVLLQVGGKAGVGHGLVRLIREGGSHD